MFFFQCIVMDKEIIISEIDSRVNEPKTPSFSAWIIGITNDTERRKGEHENDGKNTKYWRDWKADSEEEARDIEKHFKDKDMKGDTGGGKTPIFVYIF